jgi:hypothetical protein
MGDQIGARTRSLSMMNNILRWISYGMAALALVAGIALLLRDAKIWIPSDLSAAAISAAPLLLVGTAFLILQPAIRPCLIDLLKNALLAATFLLWGAIQFIPQNALSSRLSNLVIALYVVDLAWVILGSKISRERN